MRSIGTKLANLPKGGVEAAEHVVQRGRQPVQFIAGPAGFQTLIEVLGADAPGGLGHAVHRPQRPLSQDPSAPPGEQQRQRKQRRHDQEKTAACHGDALQRHAHLNQAGDATGFTHGLRQHAHGIRSQPLQRLKGVQTRSGAIQGVGAQRHPAGARGSFPGLAVAPGMAPFDVSIPGRKPEKSPKDGLHIRRDGGRAPPRGLLCQGQGHPLQRAIEVAREAIAQEPIGRAAQQEDRDGQQAGVPQGKAGANGTQRHDSVRFQDIADASHGVEQFGLSTAIDLFT